MWKFYSDLIFPFKNILKSSPITWHVTPGVLLSGSTVANRVFVWRWAVSPSSHPLLEMPTALCLWLPSNGFEDGCFRVLRVWTPISSTSLIIVPFFLRRLLATSMTSRPLNLVINTIREPSHLIKSFFVYSTMYLELGDVVPSSANVLGQKATVIYLSGSNFKCPWSHKPEYDLKKKVEKVNLNQFAEVLQKIPDKVVVVSGGEPCLQSRPLQMLCRMLHQGGKKIKLRTNGTKPAVIAELIQEELVDHIALDILAPLSDQHLYNRLAGVKADMQAIRETLDLCHLRDYHGVFEVVYPVLPGLNDKESQIKKLCKTVSYCTVFTVQGFDNRFATLDPKWQEKESIVMPVLEKLAKAVRGTLTSVEMVIIHGVGGEKIL